MLFQIASFLCVCVCVCVCVCMCWNVWIKVYARANVGGRPRTPHAPAHQMHTRTLIFSTCCAIGAHTNYTSSNIRIRTHCDTEHTMYPGFTDDESRSQTCVLLESWNNEYVCGCVRACVCWCLVVFVDCV